MSKFLLKNLTVATFDERDTVLRDASLLVDGAWIAGMAGRPEEGAASCSWGEITTEPVDHVIDLSGCVVIPGLINCHHHLYQTLTRGLKAVQDSALFDWLVAQYPLWARLTGRMVHTSALIGLSELLLSGCTTCSDMFYVFTHGSDVSVEQVIEAAAVLGIRIHAGRGSMSLGRSAGGLPPDEVVQAPDLILADTERLAKAHHNAEPGAMVRIDVMPCSPFSVTRELMRDSLALARSQGLLCQTHLAETLDEEAFCLELTGKRPLEYMADLEWLGPDISFAHGIHLNQSEIALLGQTATGVVHCPSSNMRLASGIAPVKGLLDAGAPVGIGVDGSASNDGGNLLAEARQAMLLGRVLAGPEFSARQALGLATRHAARLLRRPELGTIGVGKAADLAIFDLDRVEYAGASCHDAVGALLLCQPTRPRYVMVAGRIVVSNGQILGADLPRVVAEHNRLARQLVTAS